jgi:hypothetical protein
MCDETGECVRDALPPQPLAVPLIHPAGRSDSSDTLARR